MINYLSAIYGIKDVIYVFRMAHYCIYVSEKDLPISLVKHICINYSAIFHLLSEGDHLDIMKPKWITVKPLI